MDAHSQLNFLVGSPPLHYNYYNYYSCFGHTHILIRLIIFLVDVSPPKKITVLIVMTVMREKVNRR